MIPNWNVFGSYNSFRAFCVTITHTPDGFIISHRKHR